MKKLSKLVINRRTPKGFIEDTNFFDMLSEMRKMNSVRSHRYTADDKNFVAVILGNAEKVQKHIDRGYHDANYKDWKQRSLLHFACAYDQPQVLEVLLMNNCNINVCDWKSTTPLSVAVQCGHIECVSLLLRHGANLHLKDQSGNTAFHYAVCNGQQEMVEILLQYHADIEKKTMKHGLTPLLLALRAKRADMAQFLINKGANIFAIDNLKRNSLMYAVRCDSEDIVRLLLEKGIDIHYKDEFEWTALRYAVEGQCHVREVLLTYTKNNCGHCGPVEDNSTESKYSEEESVAGLSKDRTPGISFATSNVDECNSNSQWLSKGVLSEAAGRSSADLTDESKVEEIADEQGEKEPNMKPIQSANEEKVPVPNEAQEMTEVQEFIIEAEEYPNIKSAIERKASVTNEEIEKTLVQPFISDDEKSETEKCIIESDLEIVSVEENMPEDSGNKQELPAIRKNDFVPGVAEGMTETHKFIIESDLEIVSVEENMSDNTGNNQSTIVEKTSVPSEAKGMTETQTFIIESDLEIVSVEENMPDDSGNKQQDAGILGGAAFPREELNENRQTKDEPPLKLTSEEEQRKLGDSEHAQEGNFKRPQQLPIGFMPMSKYKRRNVKSYMKDTPDSYPHLQETVERIGSASREAPVMKEVKPLKTETSERYAPWKVSTKRNVTLPSEASDKKDVKSLHIDEQPLKLTPEQFQTRMRDIQRRRGRCNGKGPPPLLMRPVAVATDLTGTRVLMHRGKEAGPQRKKSLGRKDSVKSEATEAKNEKPLSTDTPATDRQCEALMDSADALCRDASARNDVKPCHPDTPDTYDQHEASMEREDTISWEASARKEVGPCHTDTPATDRQCEALMDSADALCRDASARNDVKPCHPDTPDANGPHEVTKERELALLSESSATKDERPCSTESGISPKKWSFPNSSEMLLKQNCFQQLIEKNANMENLINVLRKKALETKEETQKLEEEHVKKHESDHSLRSTLEQVRARRSDILCHYENLKERLRKTEEECNREIARKQRLETYSKILEMELIDFKQELFQKHCQTQRRISPEEEDRMLEYHLHTREEIGILQQKLISELQELKDEMTSHAWDVKMKHLSKKTKDQNSRLEDIAENQAQKIKKLKNRLSKMYEELSERANLTQATAEENWEESFDENQLESRMKSLESTISKMKMYNDPSQRRLKHAMQQLVLELRLRKALLQRLNQWSSIDEQEEANRHPQGELEHNRSSMPECPCVSRSLMLEFPCVRSYCSECNRSFHQTENLVAPPSSLRSCNYCRCQERCNTIVNRETE